jgi:hypothetical protein
MTGVFSGAYINHRGRFNTQDAFLERDVSDDGLTRAFAHMSIRCNPGIIPKGVLVRLPAAVLRALPRALPPDPDITRSRETTRGNVPAAAVLVQIGQTRTTNPANRFF